MFRFTTLLLLFATSATAQVVFTPLKGEFEFTALEASCPSMPSGCYTCVNDENTTADHRLMLALGATSPGVSTTGLAEGVLRPFIEVDGVRLTPDLFPCGAVLRSGITWFDRLFPQSCAGEPVGATIEIGDEPAFTVTGDGSTPFVIAAPDAVEIPFRIELCSEFVYWGAGCGISGSSQHGWRLEMPGHLDALEVSPGDAPPVALGSSEFAIDFVSSPGGVVSVSRVRADAPGLPSVPHLNGYWDVHTDLEPGSFLADVTFNVDAASFPPEVNPMGVVVGIYDENAGAWKPLATDVDVDAGTATVTTDVLSKFILAESAPLATGNRSWSAVKATY